MYKRITGKDATDDQLTKMVIGGATIIGVLRDPSEGRPAGKGPNPAEIFQLVNESFY